MLFGMGTHILPVSWSRCIETPRAQRMCQQCPARCWDEMPHAVKRPALCATQACCTICYGACKMQKVTCRWTSLVWHNLSWMHMRRHGGNAGLLIFCHLTSSRRLGTDVGLPAFNQCSQQVKAVLDACMHALHARVAVACRCGSCMQVVIRLLVIRPMPSRRSISAVVTNARNTLEAELTGERHEYRLPTTGEPPLIQVRPRKAVIS